MGGFLKQFWQVVIIYAEAVKLPVSLRTEVLFRCDRSTEGIV